MYNRLSERIDLASDEAHVWRASLKQDSDTVSHLRSFLSPDERERADRYYRAVDRDRFTVARAVLRKIIALYLPVAAGAVKFTYNKYGRPAVADDQNEPGLNFNLSHSNELALYALTDGRGVGIDIEYMRDDFATLEIAERFFAKAEVDALAALPEKQRVQAFFNCWSRKEAYIKARGLGISFPLDRFAVSLAPDAAPALLKVEDDDRETERWKMYELQPGDAYAAALIVEKPPVTLKHWDWDFRLAQSR